MLYTRFGTQLTIIANCGENKMGEGEDAFFLTVVRVKYNDVERYRFAETLRADGGLPEIFDAVGQAPVVNLDAGDFAAAVKEAV